MADVLQPKTGLRVAFEKGYTLGRVEGIALLQAFAAAHHIEAAWIAEALGQDIQRHEAAFLATRVRDTTPEEYL